MPEKQHTAPSARSKKRKPNFVHKLARHLTMSARSKKRKPNPPTDEEIRDKEIPLPRLPPAIPLPSRQKRHTAPSAACSKKRKPNQRLFVHKLARHLTIHTARSARSKKRKSNLPTDEEIRDREISDKKIRVSLRAYRRDYTAEFSIASSLPIPTLDLLTSKSCVVAQKLSPMSVIAQSSAIIRSCRNFMNYHLWGTWTGTWFNLCIPRRTEPNLIYFPQLKRYLLVKATTPSNILVDSENYLAICKILKIVSEILKKNTFITKRELFYHDVVFFKNQIQADKMIDDICCLLECTRSSLHIIALERGVVIGPVKFYDDGDLINCNKLGMGGQAIPPNSERIGNIESNALFILLVEKDATFVRLCEDRFHRRFRCIIITAKGQPDVATRMFLRRLKLELKIPILALMDSDPFGIQMLSVYMYGSINMSYDNANLTTPDIKWLGLRPTDLVKYKIPEECKIEMTDWDVQMAHKLLEKEYIKNNKEWENEVKEMLVTNKKAEIHALCSQGSDYLTEVYLPGKLRENDWF